MSKNNEDRRNDGKSGADEVDTQGSGKVADATNSTGDQPATQLNQGRRTPESRHDRESQVGSGNQAQSRQGSTTGNSTGGGGRGAG